MFKKILLLAALMTTALCMPLTAAAGGMLPNTASMLATDLDAQLAEHLGLLETPVKGYPMVVTTPVNINNLESSSPLGRQMGEELANWFVRFGYKVQEVRKGKDILVSPGRGETLLTRHTRLLDVGNVQSAIVLTATYITTTKGVRFNVRMIHAPSNEVLAMSGATMPMTDEMYEVLADSGGTAHRTGLAPSVSTRLPGM